MRHDEGVGNHSEGVMLGDVRNVQISEIELQQHLPAREGEWLVRRLRSWPGIARATCAADARHVVVEYDANRLVSADVVELLGQCGQRVAAVHRLRL